MELLAPAGNKQNLIQAVSSGADAVYLGVKNFSARSSADNFDFDELKYSVAYAKTFNVKVYLAVNTVIKNSEINEFLNVVKTAYEFGVDAFILQDIFLGKKLKELIPDICLHLSTQAGVCNVYGAMMAKNYGFSRVILARETNLEDIRAICKIIESEVFIQGALCTSFSGHCYFSSFIGGNSGNRGDCKQPCRKLYSYIVDGKPINKGFCLSLADLRLADKLSVLKDVGVTSLKIEGRMRSEEYVAVSVQYYKNLLNGKDRPDLLKALKSVYNRGDYTEGLAFTQKKDFISDKIQNHKGLVVGEVGKITGDKFLFKNYYNYEVGDSFKILRFGKEIGNAICIEENSKPVLKFKGQILIGDEVSITKDVSVINKYVLKPIKKDIEVLAFAKVGEKLTLSSNGITVYSEKVLEPAKNAPATVESITINLLKTDVYPFNVKASVKVEGNPFIINSVLNGLRSKLYAELFYGKCRKILDNINNYEDISICMEKQFDDNLAVIANEEINLTDNVKAVIIAPLDYNKNDYTSYYKNRNLKRYLYIPPFACGKDLEIIKDKVKFFDGVYGEGYWCVLLASELKVEFFAGFGLNVTNSVDVEYLEKLGVKNISISKELSSSELNDFKGNYVLKRGAIEIMDLIYCPFSKDCGNCIIKNQFIMRDTDNREFPVIRYKLNECRFKTFNNASIAYDLPNYFKGIYDLRSLNKSQIDACLNSKDLKEYKTKIVNYTAGNYGRGV